MAYVHVECLDKWRRVSSNPDSFFRCDQCHYKYEFGRAFTAFGHGFGDRFTLARLLGSSLGVSIASFLVLLALIFVSGFVAKLFGSFGLMEYETQSWGQVLNPFTIVHWTAGSVLVGGFSLLGWACEFFGVFMRAPVGRVNIFPGLGGGGGGGVEATVASSYWRSSWR